LSREKKRLVELKEANKAKDATIINTDQLRMLAPKEQEMFEDRKVIFRPNPGPQTEFLESGEDEVLFAGARGGGKSYALIVDPVRYINNKHFRALVIRKTMPELRQLIGWAHDLYKQISPGVRWKEQEKIFIFPSGAKIEFGYLETNIDVDRYRGQEYTWIGVDEITLFGSEESIDKLLGSLRTTDIELKTYFRATSNPNGPGRSWVKRRFIDKAESGETFTHTLDTPLGKINKTRKWINSVTTDNPILVARDPGYLAWLASLPEGLRKCWLEGSWDVAEGVAFPDFNAKTHVIKPFEIPANWLRFRACDWGFTSMAICLWFACDEDSNIYIYREYKTKLVDAPTFAGNVLQLERGEKVRYGIIDGSVGDQRGISGPTVDEQMRMVGCIWRYADKSPGSRIAGKNLIHRYLSISTFTGQPCLKIFENCKELIEELSSLPTDNNDAEDVDTDCADHAYDALRYGIMSRPNIVSAFDSWASMNPNPRPIIVDKQFGY
jgi:PBSX family phage terminase large subunit